jgi:hypothetical protein
VHQEGGIDRDHLAVAAVDEVGVRMPAESTVCLDQGHPVAGRQHMGRHQPSNATPDDCDRSSVEIFTFHDLYSEPGTRRMGVVRSR